MSNVYMAIGAHIGDCELTSGLVLADRALKGDKIITVALTAGERGNPSHLSVAEYRVQKVKEAHDFANLLNGEAIVFDYKDGELPDNEEVRLKVANLIRKYRPKMIFTHWKNSMHKDHELTHKIALDAQFLAGIDMGDKVIGERFFSPLYFAENWEDSESFIPYMYIPASSEAYELWCEGMKKQWFITNSKSFKYYDYYTHLSYVRGALARTTHASSFAVLEHQKRIVSSL
ncbi:PIG-L deacetylase family protein [Haploplasma modicum]|uniref:PIG-L deacetylase family protein n=1 Tax=Haploplasma modicum TaxID=2150 RepID=UPI000479482F|nr:PIG-L family deacetylase [Haploplasma modicum]